MGERLLRELPKALSRHLCYLLVTLGKRSQRMFTDVLAPHGLRPLHFDVLAVVDELGPISQARTAELLQIEPANLVALIDMLETRGLLERRASADDRRRYELTLTMEGQRLYKELGKAALHAEAMVGAGLTRQEMTVLRDMLTRLAGGR